MTQAVNVHSLLAQIQALLKEICRDECSENSQFHNYAETAIGIAEKIHDVDSAVLKSMKADSMLENAAVNLWNFAVGLKTKGTLSGLSNAKLRYISLLLVDSYIGEDADETIVKKKIMMGIKTARGWLDAGNTKLADITLQIADQSVKFLRRMIVQKINANGPTEVLQRQRIEAEQDMFRIICYRAESYTAQYRYQEALEMTFLAKEMLVNFPKEGAFLAMMCYNFGVDTYQKKKYEECTTWLRESFELGKGRSLIGPKNQARTLRLLACAYLDLGPAYFQKAQNAITLANAEYPHPAGLYINLKILLQNGDTDEMVNRAVDEIVKQTDTTIDSVTSLVQLLSDYKRAAVYQSLIQDQILRFGNSPDVCKLKGIQLELFLQTNNKDGAKQFVENCITGHNTGNPLDKEVLKRFHILLWEQAAEAFEEKDFKSALEWYNYSLSLYDTSQIGDKNLAKLHRNRANCYMYLQLNEKALDALSEAEKHDPGSIHTQFSLYKLALAESDVENARQALHKMCEIAVQNSSEDTDVHSLICLAAHMAFEQHHQSTASAALECLANTSPDHLQVLTALRCLIRIKLGETEEKCVDIENITTHIRTGYNKLLQLINDRKDLTEQLNNEANWFMKISWNMALQSEEKPHCMRDLFTLCCQLSALSGEDRNQMTRQKTCRLMAAAASLQVARKCLNEQEQRNALEDALYHVEECKRLCNQLEMNMLSAAESKTKDTTEILLLLYEFEARVKLKDQHVEEILETALKLPNPDPKTFETIAALAVEEPAQNKSMSVRALKVAIRKHLQMPTPDYIRCSKLFHSLIQLALSSGVELSGKDEAWNYFVEVIEVIDKTEQGQFPEIEILWLMTKAWNCGINFYSSGRYEEAEKWCATSMKLFQYLGSMKSNYEDHMNNTYAEILAKIESSKPKKVFKGQEE
ncbi:testis-expressed protein 11-like [Mytilus galloprovincialis]|uniref:testis-expressed protein 11-like n=1 Tax=Mytilus galloprovincialis TaxID=29158 RepID=UPI003F7BC021